MRLGLHFEAYRFDLWLGNQVQLLTPQEGVEIHTEIRIIVASEESPWTMEQDEGT